MKSLNLLSQSRIRRGERAAQSEWALQGLIEAYTLVTKGERETELDLGWGLPLGE